MGKVKDFDHFLSSLKEGPLDFFIFLFWMCLAKLHCFQELVIPQLKSTKLPSTFPMQKIQKYDCNFAFWAFDMCLTRLCVQKNHRFWFVFEHFEWILLQMLLSQTEIACWEHPQLLRKNEKIDLDALNGIFVIWRRQCANLHIVGTVPNVRRGLMKSNF